MESQLLFFCWAFADIFYFVIEKLSRKLREITVRLK